MRRAGFTLIEILVVIIIVAITLTFAVVLTLQMGTERKLKVSAESFVDYLHFVEQQAILFDAPFVIKITHNSYIAERRGAKFSIIGKTQYFPAGAKIILQPAQSVAISSTGDINNFQLRLQLDQAQKIIFVDKNKVRIQ